VRESDPRGGTRPAAVHDIPRSEWAAAGISVVIVLAALASLLYEAVRGHGSPPEFDISVVTVEPKRGGYLVRIRVVNTGASAAAQLVIEGKVTSPGGETESSQITLDYVPAQSERLAGLFFSSEPDRARLKIRALGYQDP
jgi:uncharacterized protein (TIGR02588 family)